jgi:hypothetical protein
VTTTDPGVGVPRLQEISFLEQTMRSVGASQTYDEIRLGLIGWMETLREGPAASGRYMGVRRKAGAGGRQETRFMDNATEALAELMRLGWVERTPLPTTPQALVAYRNRRFALTSSGESWLEELTARPLSARDRLLAALWPVHPQLRAYFTLLASRPITIPTLRLTDVFPDGGEQFGPPERRRYLEELATIVIGAGRAGVLGWTLEPEGLRAGIASVVENRAARAIQQGRPFPYARGQDFTRDCHKGLVAFAFASAGVGIGFTTHEILRRWGRDLGIANFSYHVPDAVPALRCWATAELDTHNGTIAAFRRGAADHADQVLAELPTAYEDARHAQGGGGFVPVYALRQLVCWRLGLNGGVFDRAVRDLLQGTRDAPFRITPDRGYAGKVPPTESALVLTDSHGRRSNYLLIMLTPTERSSR